MALRAGLFGLVLEAVLAPCRGWARPSGWARNSVGTFLWNAPAAQASSGVLLRAASNSQLRTGTDQGNPTV